MVKFVFYLLYLNFIKIYFRRIRDLNRKNKLVIRGKYGFKKNLGMNYFKIDVKFRL